jgi:MoaA/NifB/PqqE/SkfB family radical SAM enzyme
MFSAINQVDNDSFDVVWDLGRRCTYACTYCGPHHSNKTSPNTPLTVLKDTLDGIVKYATLYNQYRSSPKKTTLAFTGGEPTINPDFFDFIEYCNQKYPNVKTNITTNGCYTPKKCQQIIDNIDSCTISYHAEASDIEKQLVKNNIIAMKVADYNFRINHMFHKDHFDECIELANWFDEIGVKYTPRVIGDSDNPKDIEDGTAHIYTEEQHQWFKDYWSRGKKQKVNNEAKSCDMAQSIGRPCCAGRTLDLYIDDIWSQGSFVPTNNFKGWNCMINWDFLFINSELDGVWHHQTCQVNMDGEIGPIGKASRFDLINSKLENTLNKIRIPFIKCPKSYCGCGLCSPKALNTNTALDIFYKHTKNLEPILQDDIKEENKEFSIISMLNKFEE